MGLKVGKNLSVQNGVSIDISFCDLITIGNNVTLAPGSMILAHDASTKRIDGGGFTKTAPVKIGNKVFVGAKAVILPGVTISDNVVIGAGAIVTKDVPEGVVVAGNPAKIIMTTDEYLEKVKSNKNIKLLK